MGHSDGSSYKTTESANRIKSDLRDNMKYCWEYTLYFELTVINVLLWYTYNDMYVIYSL